MEINGLDLSDCIDTFEQCAYSWYLGWEDEHELELPSH